MYKLLLAAGTAVAIMAGAMASAEALPAGPKSATVITSPNIHQATFWRWRHWDHDWRWRRRHWHRWHRD